MAFHWSQMGFQRVSEAFRGCCRGSQEFHERTIKFQRRSMGPQGVSKAVQGFSMDLRGFIGVFHGVSERSRGFKGVAVVFHAISGYSMSVSCGKVFQKCSKAVIGTSGCFRGFHRIQQ